jgi:3-oxoacyl-[acyl-carrier-protein] synthase-3
MLSNGVTNGSTTEVAGSFLPATTGTCITGVGVEIPPTVVPTAEVEERARIRDFGFEPGWLQRVTGVRERRWAAPDVMPSDLAAAAGARALADAGCDPAAIDTVLFTGITKDFFEPATANVVAEAVGARRARVFDVMNACNGLVDGLDVADALIRSGKAERVLVTTGERASAVSNFHARTIEELIRSLAGLMVGDGGGALVLEAAGAPGRGLIAREHRSDPTQWRHAIGGRARPTDQACDLCGSVIDQRFLADGRRLFEVGLAMMPPTIAAVLARTGWTHEDLDIVFCHEAHKRFVETGAAMIGGAEKIWTTVERFGNTSTVSLPLAMAEAKAAGALAPGRRVLLIAGSSGMSMAAVTLVW